MINLMHLGHKRVAQIMKRSGYILIDSYDNAENHVAEFVKTAAGVTIKSVIITFSPAWRVISFKED